SSDWPYLPSMLPARESGEARDARPARFFTPASPRVSISSPARFSRRARLASWRSRMRKVLPYLGASLSALALAWSAPAKAQQDAFKDLDRNHWAYEAVNDLAQKGILIGYPNGYFYGKRTLTRYEFAVALERMLNKLPQILPPGPPGPVNITREEFDELRRLVNEFRNELTALGTDVRALRARLDQLAADVA